MINLDQRFKDLYNTYGGKSIRLVFYKKKYTVPRPSNGLHPSYRLYPSQTETNVVDFIITDDMIHTDTLEITESLCTQQDLDFGACESAKMEIVVSGDKYIRPRYPRDGLYPHDGLYPADSLVGREFALIESFYSTDRIYPHNGLYPGGSLYPSKDIVRGIFIVDSVPREDDKDTRRIIAYDRMARFNQDVSDWYEGLIFPLKLKHFRAGLCSYVGIPEVPADLANDDLIVEKTLNTETLNGFDLIRYVCQINGVFGNVNHSGEFRYVTISKKEKVADTITRYKSVESEEYVVPNIDAVKIRQEEGDIGGASPGGGKNFYIIEGNILAFGKTTAQLNDIASRVKNVVSGLEYRPATIVGNGAPWYEMGDRIRVKTSEGDINTIIMYRTSSGIQGPEDTIESTGSQELSQPFNVESQIIQAKGLVAKLKLTVEEVSSELIDFENQTSSKFMQTAEQISMEVKRATKAEEQLSSRIVITAEQITSEVTRAKGEELKLSSRITQTAGKIESEVTRAKGAEGQLSSKITQTATDIRAEVSGVNSNLSLRIDGAEGRIATKVTKGTISSEISQEAGKITLSANRLIVNSTKFSLDGNGNANFSGQITGGSININNVFHVDTNGNTWIDGNNFSWNADGSSLTREGDITLRSGRIAGFRIEGNNLKAVEVNSEIKGGNIVTPSLLVETGSKTVFSAVCDGEGEIIARADMEFQGNHKFFNLKVDTNEWTTSPYSNDVAAILDYIWTGRGNGWGLKELDARVSALESGSACRGYCNDGGCSDTGGCPIADDDNCPGYGGGCVECSSECSSECNWENCSAWGPGLSLIHI